MDDRAKRYARRGYRRVHGWLTGQAAEAILTLAAVQETRGVRGGAAEIGVHHGRLFVLLCLLLRADELAIGVDLFGRQAENHDGSGCGSRERVLANLRRHGVDTRSVELLEANSLEVAPRRITDAIERARLFSVDGGHTAELTYNDLALAAACSCDGGLVILDDYLHPAWPGVTEGACRFLEHGQLEPVAFVSNKLILSRGDASPYRAALHGKPTMMFGRSAIVVPDLTLRERIARTRFGRWCSGVAHQVSR